MELTAEIVKEYLRYEPDTGKHFWLKHTGRIAAGREAGYVCKHVGRVYINLLGNRCLAHRLAWLSRTGEWPIDEIDHINHDPADNRWVNLREVSHDENARNQKTRTDNTSGVCGVTFKSRDKLWVAQIRVNKKLIHLGCSKSKENAIVLRKAGERKYDFHPNHGRILSKQESGG